MSKFEKNGTITFSPTAVTDKEEVHGLHKRAEGSSGGTTIYYTDGLYLFYDEECTSSVTKEDLIKDITSGCVYVSYNSDSVSHYKYVVLDWRAADIDNHGSVKIMSKSAPSIEFSQFYTSEYTQPEEG